MRARHASFLLSSILGLTPLFAAACSSEKAEAQAETAAPGWAESENTSGSRLRAKVITGAGAREVVGFFDTLRKEDCTFRQADGNKYRCLPDAVFQQFGGLFSDATCRTPLLTVPTCAPDPKYLMTVGGVGCSSVVTGMKRITGAAQTAFTNNGTGCGPASPTTTQLKGFTVGEDVSMNDFVDAVETPVANGALTETVLVASDGARQHLSYRIAALDAECTFQIMADGITRCVPQAQQTQILYSDSDCTTPVRATGGGSSSGSCGSGESDLVRESAPIGIGCSVAKNIFKVGTAPTEGDDAGTSTITGDSSLYTAGQTTTGASCSPTQYWNVNYTRPIVNVTLTLPSTDRIGRGAGRLVPTLVTQQNSEQLIAGWHDMERNVDCTFVKASDGKMRCLPTGPTGVVFFTDTACKAPTLVAVRGGPLSCAQAASKYVRSTPNPNPSQPQTQCATSADAPTKVYELSGDVKNLGPSSFESSPGRCAQVAGVNGAIDAKEVDPALFVEGVLATE